jgi:predicted nucleic acid-binding protein
MILADTNILSTFAKIDRLLLLLRFVGDNGLGVVPTVYEEFRAGVNKGLHGPSGCRKTHPTRAD